MVFGGFDHYDDFDYFMESNLIPSGTPWKKDFEDPTHLEGVVLQKPQMTGFL